MRRLGPVLGALLALPATAHAASLRADLVPRPGPDVLYAPPPRAPQLENTGIWKAAPILVSGAVAYRDGELVYQDFLFDDHGARFAPDPADDRTSSQSTSAVNGTYTYPSDKKYVNNVADLVEVRVRPLADATAFRLTFNSMTDPGLVGTTLALGSSPEPLPAPAGANTRMPAQVFVTVHGDQADATSAVTGAPLPRPSVAIDRERRQVEVRVPKAAWDPGTGVQRIAAATGLWDAAANRYLVPAAQRTATRPGGAGPSAAPSAFFNVAFRTDEPVVEPGDPTQRFTDSRSWRDRAQARALADGVLTEHGLQVDFGKLARGEADDSGVPRTGALNRIFASAKEPGQGLDPSRSCSPSNECPDGSLLSQLQPYAIYVPNKPVPPQGFGLTLLLHSLGANYNQYSGTRNQSQFGERGTGHIVITPAGRGPASWYFNLGHDDVFEVWADVARHHRLDPERTAITGYSMGGYGTYKLGSQYPDLFGAAQTTVGPPTRGISTTGTDSTSGTQTSTLPQLEGFRHIPILIWAGTTDQLVPFTSVVGQASRFDALGYRYTFDAFTPSDHFALAANDQYAPAAEFLGESRVVRDPARVSFTVNATMEGGQANHAYWVSGIEVADRSRVRGTVDVRSEGRGEADPQPGATQRSAGALTGGTLPAISFARQSKAWAPAGTAPKADRLVIDATNVRALTIHPERAGVTCAAQLAVESDTPVTVTLAGCGRSVTIRPRAARACAPVNAFTRAAVRAAGRGLRFDVARPGRRDVTVDVFRQTAGGRVLGERRVVRFTGRSRPFSWSGAGTGDGVHVVRLTARTPGRADDVRRFALLRRGGRWSRLPAYERRPGCAVLRQAKLERPVFGGRSSRALGIAFRVGRETEVAVRVTRGGRTVRAFATRTRRAGTVHRLRLAPERLARGSYRVVIEAGGSRAVLTARRL